MIFNSSTLNPNVFVSGINDTSEICDTFIVKLYEENEAQFLISSLKKLSKNNLSNLTPHKSYVIAHYSHPTLLQRVQNLAR